MSAQSEINDPVVVLAVNHPEKPVTIILVDPAIHRRQPARDFPDRLVLEGKTRFGLVLGDKM